MTFFHAMRLEHHTILVRPNNQNRGDNNYFNHFSFRMTQCSAINPTQNLKDI